MPKTDGQFVCNDKCFTVAEKDELPQGDITTHLSEIHEGFMTRLNPDWASLSWPSGSQLSGILALSVWAMCSESLWNLYVLIVCNTHSELSKWYEDGEIFCHWVSGCHV